MRLVGFDDLQTRSSYQPTIHRRADDRYFAHIGHHGADKENPKRLNRLNDQLELNGVSIIEVKPFQETIDFDYLRQTGISL